MLLDENLPHAFRHELAGHEVVTVRFQGWSGLKNGELLRAAGAAGFDAMVTNDSGVPYQQNATTVPLSVVVLRALSNDLEDLRPLVPRLLGVLRTLTPRSIVVFE